MKLWKVFGRLDRLQRGLRFRVIATVCVVLLSLAGWGLADRYVEAGEAQRLGVVEEAAIDALVAEEERLRAMNRTFAPDDPRIERLRELETAAIEASVAAAQARLLEAERGGGVLRSLVRDAGWVFAVVIGGVVLGSVWLGFGLTCVGLLAVAVGVGYPLSVQEGTREFGLIVIGVAVLIVALLSALEAAKLGLGGGGAVSAVARNVLVEALRARVGLIFVVALVLLLALLPNVLNESQPLRYRVQQWIQYGLGLGYVLLALMTVFFGVATVAFEQRDRIIWQTVSKPVRAWQYVLGKWVGVMVLNVVLMGTIAAGVLVFSLYMERLPADGEATYHVTLGDGALIQPGINTELVPEFRSKDRRLLEDEVLVARVGIEPLPPEVNQEVLSSLLEARLRVERQQNPTFVDNEESRLVLLDDLYSTVLLRGRTIPPGFSRTFEWEGLGFLRDDPDQSRLTLRYTFNAGSNDPADVYRLRFFFNGEPWPRPDGFGMERSDELGVQTLTLGTAQLLVFPTSYIDEDGRLELVIQSAFTNPREGSFGPGGIEILYSAGGYSANFVRSMAVLLVQLGFLASVAVASATFLSYPVAVLIAFSAYLGTVMSRFLQSALADFSVTTQGGDVLPINLVASWITQPVIWVFGPFANVKPIERLADGRLISWNELFGTMIVVGVVSVVLLGLGVWVFRRRELALYSGH